MKMKNKNKTNITRREPHSAFKNDLSNSYNTSDLYLSAFLKSKGIILYNIERANKKVIFVFRDDGSIPDLVNKYFNDETVGVLTFKAALADLRSIIFNYKNP